MTLTRLLLCLFLQYLLVTASPAAAGIGLQALDIPDPGHGTIKAIVWYPTADTPQPTMPADEAQAVASGGRIAGDRLPLVVLSHGTGGSAEGHRDTAWALADAGFVVVALTHPGDNYADNSDYATRRQLTERPRHVSRTLDYVLETWPHHGRIDRNRIGIFGFSMGGYTALAGMGGRPDMAGLVAQCRMAPQKPACLALGGTDAIVRNFGDAALAIVPDPRLKAAFVAAPALPALFLPDGLLAVRKPVELWAAQQDTLVPVEPDIAIVRDGLPVAPVSHVEPEAGHYAFLAPCTASQKAAAHAICVDPPGFDRSAFHRRLNTAVIAFFKRSL